MEESEHIQTEARKLVPGTTGVPTTDEAQMDAGFPLTRPTWDPNTAKGKGGFWVTARLCFQVSKGLLAD